MLQMKNSIRVKRASSNIAYIRSICALQVSYRNDPFSVYSAHGAWESSCVLITEYRNLLCSRQNVPFMLRTRYSVIHFRGRYMHIIILLYTLWSMYYFGIDPYIYYREKCVTQPFIHHKKYERIQRRYWSYVYYKAQTLHYIYTTYLSES